MDIPWGRLNQDDGSVDLFGYFVSFREENKRFLVNGQELQSYFTTDESSPIKEDWCNAAFFRLLNSNLGRRLMTTDKGYIGMCLKEARPGDIVVVAFGSSVPWVLRQVNDGFMLVGEAYIDGIMEGETMDKLKEGNFAIRNFELL